MLINTFRNSKAVLCLFPSDAQWATLPCCCCDPGCHVHLWRNCGQQCAQWRNVQIPGLCETDSLLQFYVQLHVDIPN